MRLILIDDDPMICYALKTILEQEVDIRVVATGHRYEDALSLYAEHKPDLCLFDIQLGGKTGLDAAEALRTQYGFSQILFLTTFLDDQYIQKSLELGTKGYILKSDFESIVPAVRAVHAGQTVFGDAVIKKIPTLEDTKSNKHEDLGLTEKEAEVFALVSEGLSNREIAQKLFLSEGTVRNYISKLLEKLELRDRTQLAIFYYKKK